MNPSKPKLRSGTSPPFYSDSPDVKINKMPRRSFLKPTLLLVLFSLFALCFTYFSSTHIPSYSLFRPGRNSPELRISTGGSGVPKVRIYMYDLPRKFTYGVIESYEKARGATTSGRKDDALFKYPGHQHSAEWHLFQYLIQLSKERVDSFVTRVDDPEDADLFYVPFFSSLSLVVKNNRPGSLDTTPYSDEEMQESLIEWLEKQVYWKRNNGWDHVFICQDPNALYKVVDRVKNGVLLVSDFGRLSRNQASLVKDVILPYSHRINTYEGDIGVDNRDKLLFFMGNRYRKEGGKVRDLLFQVLENEKDVAIKHGAQSRESRREARYGMHTSKFCLHPAGDTPSACRLFDAILSLCIPVVVSDYIELPFEDVIDYRKIAIFVDTSTAVKKGRLVKLLRQVTPDRIVEFQQELRKVKHYFEYEDPNGTVKEIWREVSQKLPLVKLMINRDKRLVIRPDLLSDDRGDCSCLCSNQSGVHTIIR